MVLVLVTAGTSVGFLVGRAILGTELELSRWKPVGQRGPMGVRNVQEVKMQSCGHREGMVT